MPESESSVLHVAPAAAAEETPSGLAFTRLLKLATAEAANQLASDGEIAPFALILNENEEPCRVSTEPPSEDVGMLEAYRIAMQAVAGRGEVVASAIAWDAVAEPKGGGTPIDVLVVSLDHRDSASTTAYVPYDLEGGQMKPDGAFREKGHGGVFPAQMA